MNKKTWLIALAACLLLAALSPLASSSPDGLERVAEDGGFAGLGAVSPLSVVAGYLFPGVRNEALATVLAGWLGTLTVFALAYAVAWFIYRLRRRPARP